MTIDQIDEETHWSKFFLHGIPVDTSMEAITISLWSKYPEFTLAQTQQWLIAD